MKNLLKLLVVIIFFQFSNTSFAQVWTVKEVTVTSNGCSYLKENANVRAFVSDGNGEPKSNGSHVYIKNYSSNKHSIEYIGSEIGQGVFRELKPGEEIEIDLARYVNQKTRISQLKFTLL